MAALRYVSKDDVMRGILKYSEFNNFYYQEFILREKTTPIKWLIDPIRWSKTSHYAFQGIHSRTSDPVISLPRLPMTSDEAFVVAHKIEHVFRKLDGLSISIFTRYHIDESINLAEQIRNMFEDPLIDSFLQNKYNFNPGYHYSEIDIPRSLEFLNGPFGKPQNDIDIIKSIVYYTTQLLQWDSIKDKNALQKWHDYQNTFRSWLAPIAKSGEELHAIAIENGYDSIEKQGQIIKKMFDNYSIDSVILGDILYIE